MFELVPPNAAFHRSFLESHREWAGVHQDGAAVFMAEDVTSRRASLIGLASCWTLKARRRRTALFRAPTSGSRKVHATWGGDCVPAPLDPGSPELGRAHRLRDSTSDRRRGAATWALRELLSRLVVQGESGEALPDRVLLTCDDDNSASIRTIERCDGLLEDVRTGEGGRLFRRYWIDLGKPAAD